MGCWRVGATVAPELPGAHRLANAGERGGAAVLVGVARVDAALGHLLQAVMNPATAKGDGAGPVERALNVLRKLRNPFAQSAELASLGDAAHSSRLAEVYADARENPLWAPLETVLAALRDYILLITILMAFLEATAQQVRPIQPPVAMGFSGSTGIS